MFVFLSLCVSLYLCWSMSWQNSWQSPQFSFLGFTLIWNWWEVVTMSQVAMLLKSSQLYSYRCTALKFWSKYSTVMVTFILHNWSNANTTIVQETVWQSETHIHHQIKVRFLYMLNVICDTIVGIFLETLAIYVFFQMILRYRPNGIFSIRILWPTSWKWLYLWGLVADDRSDKKSFIVFAEIF